MGLGTMYGALVGVILLLSWLSHAHVVQKLSLLLLTAWSFTNLAVTYMGFEDAPMVNPTIDAIIAVLIATLGFTNKSKLALVVFLLYVAVGATHVAAWATHTQETRRYYDVLGVLFMAQLLAVGGWGGRLALRHRALGRHQRLGAHPAGRSGVAWRA